VDVAYPCVTEITWESWVASLTEVRTPDDAATTVDALPIIPVIWLVGVVVVALSATAAAYFLTEEGRARMQVALASAKSAEEVMALVRSGQATPDQAAALIANLPKPPAESVGLLGTLGTLGVVAALGGVAYFFLRRRTAGG
jgi:hypothetical protein